MFRIVVSIFGMISFMASSLMGWCADTHESLTYETLVAVPAENNRFHQYLEYFGCEIDPEEGLDNCVTLTGWIDGYFQDLADRGLERRYRRPLREWIIEGAKLEDGPLSIKRSRHHFHDPVDNCGLNNNTDDFFAFRVLRQEETIDWLFNCEGASAWYWVSEGMSEYSPCMNNHTFAHLRAMQLQAVTSHSYVGRENSLLKFCIDLGHVMHLLEDMSVPAHVRNDFLYSHLRSSKDSGNPLEIWVDNEIVRYNATLDESQLRVPPAWRPAPAQAVVFSSLKDYWDTDDRPYNQHNVTYPSTAWGLSEATNYQFLSWSTMFSRPDLEVQDYPHPAEGNCSIATPLAELSYYSGYGMSCLARQTVFDQYRATNPELEPFRYLCNTPVDRLSFQEYAETTIPRTLNYTTGLMNYIFRGQLEVEYSGAHEDGRLKYTIMNTSINTDVPQIIHNGSFYLFWDRLEETAGIEHTVRSAVDSDRYTVLASSSSSAQWNSSSSLDYYDISDPEPATTTLLIDPAFFTTDETDEFTQFVLVYQGNISENPANPDPDDPDALAVAMFEGVGSGIVAMCWIDESISTYYNNAAAYDADLTAYRQLLSQHPEDNIVSGCLVPPSSQALCSGDIYCILPQGYSPPPEISVQLCGRPPTLGELIADFDRIRGSIEPLHVVLCVDGSGSMTLATIQPGYGEFVDWLEYNYPEAIIHENTMSPFQQWVESLTNGIDEALGN